MDYFIEGIDIDSPFSLQVSLGQASEHIFPFVSKLDFNILIEPGALDWTGFRYDTQRTSLHDDLRCALIS